MSILRDIKAGDSIPYGLSIKRNGQQKDGKFELYLALPVLRLYRVHFYQINSDTFVDGWFTLSVMAKFTLGWGWFSVMLAKGWR